MSKFVSLPCVCGVSICLLHNEVEQRPHQYVSDSYHKPRKYGKVSPTPSTVNNADPTIRDLTIDEDNHGAKSDFGRAAAKCPKTMQAHQCSLLEADISEFHQDIRLPNDAQNFPILPVFLNMFVNLCLGVVKDVCPWMYGCC